MKDGNSTAVSDTDYAEADLELVDDEFLHKQDETPNSPDSNRTWNPKASFNRCLNTIFNLYLYKENLSNIHKNNQESTFFRNEIWWIFENNKKQNKFLFQ